jgi:hypothetical protein
MARWLRLQLGHGSFEGRRIVSPENLAVTHVSKVALNDTLFYAMGWYNLRTANGDIVWHDGDALSFSSFVGMAPARNTGIVILANETNVGLPAAIGAWLLDRVLGNPDIDHVAIKLPEVIAGFTTAEQKFAKPGHPLPFPLLASLTGVFVNPSFGTAMVDQVGNALVMEIRATGARFKIETWDGVVLVARLIPEGDFEAVAALNYKTTAFVQFHMADDGKPGLLRLAFDDGQQFDFRRQ